MVKSTINGNNIEAVSINGDEVIEITANGDSVWIKSVDGFNYLESWESGTLSGWNADSSTSVILQNDAVDGNYVIYDNSSTSSTSPDSAYNSGASNDMIYFDFSVYFKIENDIDFSNARASMTDRNSNSIDMSASIRRSDLELRIRENGSIIEEVSNFVPIQEGSIHKMRCVSNESGTIVEFDESTIINTSTKFSSRHELFPEIKWSEFDGWFDVFEYTVIE